MSCIISSAVCCAFFCTSMSGIALGYNYSLAEYIDLKETNVSVYIKRGVFDDDVADDMGWRRSGNQPPSGMFPNKDMITEPPSDEIDESQLTQSGRRMEDSLFESDDRNQFEGPLMKLTARPPYVPDKNSGVPGLSLGDIRGRHHGNTLDQLKDIKAVINMRRSGGGNVDGKGMQKTTYNIDDSHLEFAPSPPMPAEPGMGLMPIEQRGMEQDIVNPRDAVPGQRINEESKWFLPKLSPEQIKNMVADYGEIRPTYPPPVTYRAGPRRSSTRSTPSSTVTEARIVAPTRSTEIKGSKDRSLNEFREDMMLESLKSDEILGMKSGGSGKSEGEEYDEVRGLPVRKKRNIKMKENHKFHIKKEPDVIKNIKITSKKYADGDSKSVDIEYSKLVDIIKVITSNTKFLHTMADTKDGENIFKQNTEVSTKKYSFKESSNNVIRILDLKPINAISKSENRRDDYLVKDNSRILRLLQSTIS